LEAAVDAEVVEGEIAQGGDAAAAVDRDRAAG
jgi:hypothetical protein